MPRRAPGFLLARPLLRLAAAGAGASFGAAASLAAQPSGRSPAPATLPPSAFAEVPAPVRAALTARGCRVVQLPEEGPGRRNLVSGDLLRTGEPAWAALCARGVRTGTDAGTGVGTGTRTRAGTDVVLVVPERDTARVVVLTGAFRGLALDVTPPQQADLVEEGEGCPKAPPLTHALLRLGSEQASAYRYYDGARWWALCADD
ncbi:hypothetical protein tb265_06930 [Gemmatimonadetes bacterium T265]|nr:hypothetical protein tb265_06930 [Gemmatimonadetes bacterium T265]